MKTKFFTRFCNRALTAMALLATLTFTACSDDDDDPKIPDPQTFAGQLTSTVPKMPTFEAVTADNTAVVTWGNAEQTQATVKLGAFKISANTPMGAMSYEIGEMEITGVTCKKEGGNITLAQPAFECIAGTFDTTGALTGELKDGKLTFTLLYKPGSMPFEVQSVFETK